MNERVKQLWSEAAKSNFGDSWEEQTAFMSKFAELIVEECTTVIDRTLFQNIGWNTSRAVRRHFGIDGDDE